MSRKDTIIIAVLINAGLLIILFASALKNNVPTQEIAAVPTSRFVEPAVKKQPHIPGGDEVDQALKEMTNQPVASFASAPLAPSSFPPASAQPSALPQMSFADDLKAFSLPETPALPLASPAMEKSAEYIEVKVKKGDVLEKIARHNHTTVDEIIAYNKLPSTNLRIGQVLKIPNAKVATTTTTSANSAPNPKYYVVKNGDNPWTIAVKNHMKVEELLKLNNLDQEKARKLKPGDKLLIK